MRQEAAMFQIGCENRCDESMGFPVRLRPVVRDIAPFVNAGELHPPRHAFKVNLDREELRIPYRLYYSPDLLRRRLHDSQGSARLILACLGTRHYDGYVRQECLGVLLESSEAWCTPYLVQLAGEYVVEIADDVAAGIVQRDPATLAAFASENADYLATFARRVRSYWHCYHRQAYPEQAHYPGAKVLAVLTEAVR